MSRRCWARCATSASTACWGRRATAAVILSSPCSWRGSLLRPPSWPPPACSIRSLRHRASARCSASGPSNAQAQVALGAALALSGDLDGGIARMKQGIKLSPRDRRLAFWGWALGGFLMRAKRPAEALEEAKLAARRDPRLFLPPVLETLAQRVSRTGGKNR